MIAPALLLAAAVAGPLPPGDLVEHPWLPGDLRGSASVGTAQGGYLVGGVPLPQDHPHLRLLPTQAARHLHHGSQELVAALLRAADAVAAEFPGAVTWAGNLSRPEGGDIPWSSSHNSGRDADVAFHLLDPAGRPASRPDLVELDHAGWAFDEQGAVRFDAARTWALVRTLLRDPDAVVQFLFISDPLRSQLLAEAARRGEPEDLVAAARTVLRQPTGKPPHDDHLHLRIHCTRRDLLNGCREGGPERPGAPDRAAIAAGRTAQALALLESPEADLRRRAAWLLGLLGHTPATGPIARRLADADPAVRARAAIALVDLRGAGAAQALMDALPREKDPGVAYVIAWAAAEVDPLRAPAALVQALDRPDGGPGAPPLRAQVAGLLADLGASRATPRLVDLLVDPDPAVREAGRRALARLAAVDLGEDMAPWRTWWARARTRTRPEWVREGLAAAGYDPTAVAGLAAAVGDPAPFVSENARRALMGLYHLRDRTNLMWPTEDAVWFWTALARRSPR